jgi:general secretion pathway protein N
VIGTGIGKLGLGVALLALSGIVASEIMARQSTPDRPSIPTAPISARQWPNPIEAANQIDGILRDTLARPIFSPDRRPVASNARVTSGLPRLTGIVVTGPQKTAIFASPPGGRPITAEEGGHVGAYEVVEITTAGVTISGPDGTKVITPIFDPAASPPAKRTLPARTEKPTPPAK